MSPLRHCSKALLGASCEAPDSRTVSFRPASLIEFDNISPISDEAEAGSLHIDIYIYILMLIMFLVDLSWLCSDFLAQFGPCRQWFPAEGSLGNPCEIDNRLVGREPQFRLAGGLHTKWRMHQGRRQESQVQGWPCDLCHWMPPWSETDFNDFEWLIMSRKLASASWSSSCFSKVLTGAWIANYVLPPDPSPLGCLGSSFLA